MTKGKKEVEKKAKALERLNIEYIDVESIGPNPYNPNRQSEHDFNLLLKSMEEDGFTQPIIVHREKRQIVDGEHRWRAAKHLGHTTVPVVFVDFTEEQMRISTLRHNRARGSEDIELSAEVLRDLRELGALDWAQDSLMLSDVEMNALLDDVSAPEMLAGEEFGEAWEPVKHTQESNVTDASGSVREVSMTASAADARRKMEQRLAEAKTEEEREQARKDDDTYRVVAIFGGEEARDVRAVLGTKAAEIILRLCREEAARQQTA